MTKNQTVEIRLAYTWDCDNCGAENFERAVVHELTEEEIAELRDSADADLAQTGNWMTHPEQVVCRSCGTSFAAKHFNADDDARVEQDSD